MTKMLQFLGIAFSLVACAAAQTYAPFQISSLTTHQPNGNPAGQVNYYHISFNVSSTNGRTLEDAYCWTFWGDNGLFCGDSCVPYSINVPTGRWIQCAHNASNIGDQTSNYAFQLYPGFSIGDFDVALQQTLTLSGSIIATTQSDQYTVTNSSAAGLVCNINPEEVEYEQHCQGDCSTPPDFKGYTVPVVQTKYCDIAAPVRLSFPVTEQTGPGDEVYVVGNITALGDWDPDRAVALNNASYTDRNTLWTGGEVTLPIGTTFEYKYVQRNADGSLLWECGENRVWTTGYSSLEQCGTQTAGNNPDYFRCGLH